MSTQTGIFRRLVSDRLGDAPVLVTPDASVGEVVERMKAQAATCAVIVDAEGAAAGIVTEQDVTRRIAFRIAPETPAAGVMSAPVVTIRDSDYLYHAVAFMRRRGLRHIPVVDDRAQVRGMLALDEALELLSTETMALIEALTHEETLEGLARIKQAQAELAGSLFADNVPVPEVQALLSDINRDIHRRLLRRHLAEMADDPARGAPPVPFALLILGSGGRGENFLYPDQDNAFILGDYPDSDHARIDGFFIELAERLTRDLDAVGLPLCHGYVMATNPVWRKTRSQWREQIAYWMRSRSPATLRYCDIFFDFAPVWDEADLAGELRDFVTGVAARNPGFLNDMYEIQKDHTVALGWFGQLATQTDADGRKGLIDMKYRGTLPLVEAARLLALRHGIAEVSTLARLDGLRAKGLIDANAHDYLAGGLEHITRLLLRQQLRDFEAGRRVTNLVPKESLSKREKDYLADCFRAVRDLRGRLASEFSTDF